jgi:hypothetical protein
MKAILEFNLPEDNDDYKIISNAFLTAETINEFDQFLRNKVKYGDYNKKETVEDIYQEIRDKLYEIANENGIEIGL